jgi:hypothetical protein
MADKKQIFDTRILPLLQSAVEMAQANGIPLACFGEPIPGEMIEVFACPVQPTMPFMLGTNAFRAAGDAKQIIMMAASVLPDVPKTKDPECPSSVDSEITQKEQLPSSG